MKSLLLAILLVALAPLSALAQINVGSGGGGGLASVSFQTNGATVLAGGAINLIAGTNVVLRGTNNASVADIQINAVSGGGGSATPVSTNGAIQYAVGSGTGLYGTNTTSERLRYTNGTLHVHTSGTGEFSGVGGGGGQVAMSVSTTTNTLNPFGMNLVNSSPTWSMQFNGSNEFSVSHQNIDLSNSGQIGTAITGARSVTSSNYTGLYKPLTVSSTNLLADGSIGGFFTNSIRTGPRTNIVIQVGDGQTVRLDLWVTNGATVDLRSAADVAFPDAWYSDGSATAVNSNGLSTVFVTRIGEWTNITIRTPSFSLAAAGMTTNYATRVITITGTAAPWPATTGGPGGTNLTVDFTALGPTNDITFTFGTSNICIFPTNIVAGKVVRLAITQASTGFGTIGTNSGLTQLRLRVGSTVTGFNCTTNGGFIDTFSLYGVGTNAQLVGNVMGFAP